MNGKWQSFVNRLKQESKHGVVKNNTEGLVIITSHVLVNGNGEPLVWVVNEGKRIEPSRDAASIIKMILDMED